MNNKKYLLLIILFLISLTSVTAYNLTIDKVYNKVGTEITNYNFYITNTTLVNGIVNFNTSEVTQTGSINYVIKETYNPGTYFIVTYVNKYRRISSTYDVYTIDQYTYADGTKANTSELSISSTIYQEINVSNPYPNKLVSRIDHYLKTDGAAQTAYLKNVTIIGASNFSTNATYNNSQKSNSLNSGNYYFYIYNSNNYQGNINYTFTNTSDVTINLTGFYNSTLNLGFKNAVTSASVSNFSGWVSYNGLNETYSTTTGTASLNLITGYNYSSYATSTGYIITSSNYQIINHATTPQSYNFSIYPGNTLILTTKDLYYDTNLSNVSVNLTGPANYVYLVNNSSTFTNLTSGVYNVLVGKGGYTSFTDTLTIGSTILTNKTYYLSSSGTSISFYVKNIYGQFLEGAEVNVSRSTDNALIGSKDTDSVGAATFVLDTNINYRVSVTLDNYQDYSGLIEPSSSTFILVLGTELNSTPDFYSGINYAFNPYTSSSITNESYESFNFTYNSTYWNVTSCYLSLRNISSSVLNSTIMGNCNLFNGSGVIDVYTGNNSNLYLYATLTITTNETIQNISFLKTYSITAWYEGDYSIKHALDDFALFDNAGFNQSNKLFLVFIIIFSVTLTAARERINEYVNSANLLLLLTLLVGLASYSNLLTLDFLSQSSIFGAIMSQYGILVLISALTIVTYILNANDER